MTGHSHTDGGKGKEFGLAVMQHLNDACNKWKEEENIDFEAIQKPLDKPHKVWYNKYVIKGDGL